MYLRASKEMRRNCDQQRVELLLFTDLETTESQGDQRGTTTDSTALGY